MSKALREDIQKKQIAEADISRKIILNIDNISVHRNHPLGKVIIVLV